MFNFGINRCVSYTNGYGASRTLPQVGVRLLRAALPPPPHTEHVVRRLRDALAAVDGRLDLDGGDVEDGGADVQQLRGVGDGLREGDEVRVPQGGARRRRRRRRRRRSAVHHVSRVLVTKPRVQRQTGAIIDGRVNEENMTPVKQSAHFVTVDSHCFCLNGP